MKIQSNMVNFNIGTVSFPKWHFGMLNDVARNNAIEWSIRDNNPQGKVIFEIGAGTGVVALAFAKYGANKIYTCESNRHMYEVARSIIAASPYRNVIELIYGHSKEVLLPIREQIAPDIIFTETLDCGVVGEGYADIVRDIANLLTEKTIIMPACITQSGMMISSSEINGLNKVQNAMGFDISKLNIYRTRGYFPVRLELYEYLSLGKTAVIRNYTYSEVSSSTQFSMQATRNGLCHGILSWLKADFGGHHVTTKPFSSSHWHQAFHPFHEPLMLSKNRTYSFNIDIDGVITCLNEYADMAPAI